MNLTQTNSNTLINDDQEIVDFGEYFAIVFRHKWFIFFLVSVFVAIAIFIVSGISLVYQSTASIMLQTQQSKITSIQELYGIEKDNTQYYKSQVAILNSRILAKHVVEQLNLAENPDFNPFLNPKASWDDNFKNYLKGTLPVDWLPQKWYEIKQPLAYKDLEKKLIKKYLMQLDISSYKKSQQIDISFESKSPELAASIVMTLISNYIDLGFKDKASQTNMALGWMIERLKSLKINLQQSEEKLVGYRAEANLLDVMGVKSTSIKDIDDISINLRNARRERVQLESMYQQIISSNPSLSLYESIPGVLDNSAVQNAKGNVNQAQAKLIDLSKRYGKKHPKMESAIANYKEAKMNYAQVLKNIISGIEKQYRIAQANEQSLKLDLNGAKNKIRTINQKSYKLRELERDVETNRRLYETFFTRYKEASEGTGPEFASAKVIDAAVVAEYPIKPKKKLIVIVVFVFSLCLGILYAFIAESMDKTFRAPVHIEQKLSQSLMGVLPKIKYSSKDEELFIPFIEDKRSIYAESIRTIRTSLLLSVMDKNKKITMITSSIPDEGKTSIALNLAIAMGQSEKVLLIDADMRKSSLANLLGLETSFGLSSLIENESQIDQTIHRFEKWSVDVLPAGNPSSNSQELLSSKEFVSLLDTLSSMYDRIIIDTPPILAVADSLLISKHVNSLIYVVRAEYTSFSEARYGIDQIKQLNVPLTGIVFNQFDIKKASGYHKSDYYSGYYEDYGYNT